MGHEISYVDAWYCNLLVQLLSNRLRSLCVLQHGRRYRLTVVKRWHRTYSSITLVALDCFRDRRAQARFRRRHRLVLRRGVRQIVAFLDFLGFCDLAGLVVDNDFRVFALARRVCGKLSAPSSSSNFPEIGL